MESQVIGIQYVNDVEYSTDDLKLFCETVCVKIGLNSLRTFLEKDGYHSGRLQQLVSNISNGRGGAAGFEFIDITDTAKAFHKLLFDMMFLKKLRDLPLIINDCDWTMKEVLSWRFTVGK